MQYMFSSKPIKYDQNKHNANFVLNHCGYHKNPDRNLVIKRGLEREDHHIVFIESGAMDVKIGEETQKMIAGDLVYFPPHTPQNYIYFSLPTAVYYWIHFSGNETEKFLKECNLQNKVYKISSVVELAEDIKKMMFATNSEGAMGFYKANAILQMFLVKVAELISPQIKKTPLQNKISKIAKEIKENPEKKVYNKELAKQCNICEHHFIRSFKKETGYSPAEFRLIQLLQKARHLLLETDLKVFEIAEILGFNDPLYFSRCFKTHFGSSPLKYKNKN